VPDGAQAKMTRPTVFIVLALLLVCSHALAAEPAFVDVKTFDAPEAVQGVAVDSKFIYAIGDDVIAKYDKKTHVRGQVWNATPELPLHHLNAGVVINEYLYCANSNFPDYPEASSVEIWDTRNLKHVGSHSLGIYEGSLTWVDWHDGSWWAVFAHYTKKVNDNPHAKDSRWTSLVRFDSQWRRIGGWTFPPEVIERFQPHSSSGGGWGPDGKLWCSGHDLGEMYCLELPQAGPQLKFVRTLSVPITGQAIAWDRSQPGMFYGIDRPKRQIVIARLAQ
jgi:hypothetical protein